jgi:hypothetical protein
VFADLDPRYRREPLDERAPDHFAGGPPEQARGRLVPSADQPAGVGQDGGIREGFEERCVRHGLEVWVRTTLVH